MRQRFSGRLHGERLASNVIGELTRCVLLRQFTEGTESVACIFDSLEEFIDLSVQISATLLAPRSLA